MIPDESKHTKVTFPMSVAGKFYPADPIRLKKEIQAYLHAAEIEPTNDSVFAILCPHAGYVFSAPVAAYSFRFAERQNPDTVLFIALSHQGARGGCVANGKAFQTPFGDIEIDAELSGALIKAGEPMRFDNDPYFGEHSIEVNLPFVKHCFPRAQVAAVLTSQTDPRQCADLGRKIASALRGFPSKKTLVCVSSDMSHYPDYESAYRIDQAMLASLESMDPGLIYSELKRLESEPVSNLHCVMCGSSAMLVAVEAARGMNATSAKTLCYRNSGDSPMGDRGRVVGYGALAMIHASERHTSERHASERNSAVEMNSMLDIASAADKAELLRIARASVESIFTPAEVAPCSGSPTLQNEYGAFVTLKNNGELRGCLGRFEPNGVALGELIAILAKEAAVSDGRFSPLRSDELASLEISISILGPLRLIRDPAEIEIGRHGIKIVGAGKFGWGRTGTLLPQVASERGWSVEEFLQRACVKANLAPDAWSDPKNEMYIYEADVFGDAK